MAVRGLDRGERAALVVNECQVGVIGRSGREGLHHQVAERRIVERIAELSAAFRAAGAPVVHTTIVVRADGVGTEANCLLLASLKKRGRLVEGTPGADIDTGVRPAPQDVVIRRQHGLTPFHNTELEPLLRERGVRTVVLAGVSTNIAIPGACVEAVNRGFRVVVAEDCTAGAWPEAHEFQVRHTLPLLATVASASDIAAALRADRPGAARE